MSNEQRKTGGGGRVAEVARGRCQTSVAGRGQGAANGCVSRWCLAPSFTGRVGRSDDCVSCWCLAPSYNAG
jgi:hypothetical protein